MPGPSGIVDAHGREIGAPVFQVTILPVGMNLERQAGLQTHQATAQVASVRDAINTVAGKWFEQFDAAEIPHPEIFHLSATRVR